MNELRYIHCADLHLDAPFRGLSNSLLSQLSEHLRKATFTALNRLIKLCKKEKPDFLVISGDVYNQEEESIRAPLALHKACEELSDIPVFIVHGNHDPLSSVRHSLKWPKNVHIFSSDLQTIPVKKDDQILALVHGISHAANNEARNLAKLFKRDLSFDGFQLGVLHCQVGNANSQDRYAPCSLEDLTAAGLDAWALGHAHERRILNDQPFIAYSGNTQGLHINETGLRGCYLVKARCQNGSWQCEADFRPLNSIQWEKLAVDLGDVGTLDVANQKLQEQLENLLSNSPSSIEGILIRLRLTGKTIINDDLRNDLVLKDLKENLAHFSIENPAVWIKDIEVHTTDLNQNYDYLNCDDLRGEVARFSQKLLSGEENLKLFAEQAFKPLAGKLPKGMAELNESQLEDILIEAQRLCMNVLEKQK